jgi:hypothetical protein
MHISTPTSTNPLLNPTAGRRPDRRWPVLLTMCVGLFLVQLDLTAVKVALRPSGWSWAHR